MAPRAVRLETERLLLRPLEARDHDALFRIFGDAAAIEHFPRAYAPDEAQAILRRHRAWQDERGLGLLAVELRATGEVVGDCGVSPLVVEGEPVHEVAWHLQPAHRGRGYATEAARAVLAHARHAHGLARVVALVRPENAPSRRVAERLGMRVERTVAHAGLAHLLYVTP